MNCACRRIDINDVTTDFSLKYLKVLSVVDISSREYENWRKLSPFYQNVSKEGIIQIFSLLQRQNRNFN